MDRSAISTKINNLPLQKIGKVIGYRQSLANHRQTGVVNTPLPTDVYVLVGILREWPGLATEVTCSRQTWDAGL
jgi:hypothetical protein